MTDRNENTTRTTTRLTAEVLTAATTAMTKAWDELSATSHEEAEALTASLTDLIDGDRGADTAADLNQPAVAEALGGEGVWADWEDEDWLAWDAAVTATAKEWLTTHYPDPTATLTLSGEEAQVLEEVLSYETDTLDDADYETEEEAKELASRAAATRAITDRLNSTEGMMTTGGSLTVTLAEAIAIAEAVDDAGWCLSETKGDDVFEGDWDEAVEEANRCRVVADTAYTIRNDKLSAAIIELVKPLDTLPEVLVDADGWLGGIVAEARSEG